MFNYRIIRHNDDGYTWYGLHEVFYDKDGEVKEAAEFPSCYSDSPEELITEIELQLKDAKDMKEDVLDFDAIPQRTT